MFEYDTVDFASHNVGAFLRHLNKLAAEGWQVICAINGGTLLIGRRLTPDALDEGKAPAQEDIYDLKPLSTQKGVLNLTPRK